jgi:hypothetical protein
MAASKRSARGRKTRHRSIEERAGKAQAGGWPHRTTLLVASTFMRATAFVRVSLVASCNVTPSVSDPVLRRIERAWHPRRTDQ